MNYDDILEQIKAHESSLEVAWKDVNAPTSSELDQELDDIDAIQLLPELKAVDFESLVQNPGILNINFFFPYAGPRCKQYFLKIYLKHALYLMKSNRSLSPSSSDMLVNLHSYITNKRYGLKYDRDLFTQDQYELVSKIIKFIYSHPALIDNNGFDGEMISRFL